MGRKSKRKRGAESAAPPTTPQVADGTARRVAVGPSKAPAAAASESNPKTAAAVLDSAVAPSAPKTAPVTARESAAGPVATAVMPAPETPPPSEDPIGTLGELLSAAREARGLSLEEASARTRIASKMLRHLENDCFGEFAAEAYVRGFLRNYGAFLGLDTDMLLRRYQALSGGRVEPAPDLWEEVVVPPSPRRKVPQPGPRTWITLAAAAAIAAAFGLVRTVGDRAPRLELRPTAGLNQIENELRAAQAGSGAQTQTGPSAGLETPSQPMGNATETLTEPVLPKREDTAPPVLGGSGPALGVPQALPPQDGSAPAPASRRNADAYAAAPVPVLPGTSAAQSSTGITDLIEPAPGAHDPATSLVLTATALDTCVLRLQVDSDARHAQRYTFTRRGESRTWTARQSFRVLARQAGNLELRLNGKLVSLREGRTLVLDGATLRPAAGCTGYAPSRGRRGRRARDRAVTPPSTSPTPPSAASPVP